MVTLLSLLCVCLSVTRVYGGCSVLIFSLPSSSLFLLNQHQGQDGGSDQGGAQPHLPGHEEGQAPVSQCYLVLTLEWQKEGSGLAQACTFL